MAHKIPSVTPDMASHLNRDTHKPRFLRRLELTRDPCLRRRCEEV